MSTGPTSTDFLRENINADLASGRYDRVHTRFPPEPNGYLHIGHAKSICLNFGIARDYNGLCNLRFDDTNPTKEEIEYVDSIMEDVRWLGFDWEDRLYYASDYFDQLYEWAEKMILAGQAYVCDLSADEVREHRGTLTAPGRNSPYRERSVEENLDLFQQYVEWRCFSSSFISLSGVPRPGEGGVYVPGRCRGRGDLVELTHVREGSPRAARQ